MSVAFSHAQALYDAAEPDWNEPEAREPEDILEDVVTALDAAGVIGDSEVVHRLRASREATVGIWIDGHEYSLTLNRED